MQKVDVKKDVIRNANGTTTSTVVPTNQTIVKEKKFSVAATTDKMGITTAGKLTRSFFWGAALATIAIMVIGARTKKITLNYTK